MQTEPPWKFAPGEPHARNELTLRVRSRWLSALFPGRSDWRLATAAKRLNVVRSKPNAAIAQCEYRHELGGRRCIELNVSVSSCW